MNSECESSTPPKPTKMGDLAKKLEVDNRLSLGYYLRIADTLLKQAAVYREENNVVDLYVMLIRFSSLVSETIPFHRDYQAFNPRERAHYKKKLMAVIDELETLKPEFQRLVDEHNKACTEMQEKQFHRREMTSYGSETSLAWPAAYDPSYENKQSKDELLYQQVSYGNVEGIKTLHSEGVGLEYTDREGKTPLILACLNPALYDVAKTLIELGANINAYRPGRNGGTPLHHAAKRGLENVVKLLLSHGANALLINDDCQTPLELARAKGYSNVVRVIESHICLYSGWLRELYGPGFLELFAPQLLSRKVWVVVLPCGSRNLRKPFRLELAIYTNVQDAQPCTTIALWRATMEEPAFNQSNPSVTISEASIIRKHGKKRSCRPRRVSQTCVKLASLDENNKQQLQQFCSACKGIPQVMHPNFPFNHSTPFPPSTAPPAATEVPPVSKNTASPAADEDVELSMAINASIQSAMEEGISVDHLRSPNDASSSSSTAAHSVSSNTQVDPPSKKASCSNQLVEEGETSVTSAITTNESPTPMPAPSAPALTEEGFPEGPIHYPTIDSSMFATVETNHTNEDGSKRGESSSCVICFDAPVEGACVPCGHMAGCMSCLNEIKDKKWGCPVCRTNIDQVIKVFSV